MKISELKTDEAISVLCEITPYVMDIAEDSELLSELANAVNVKENTTLAERVALIAGKLSKIMPILLKKKKSDIFGILGALNNKTPDEIAEQNVLKTAMQVRETIKDEDFIAFFKSCTGSAGSE